MAKFNWNRLFVLSAIICSVLSCGIKDEVDPSLGVLDISEQNTVNCEFNTERLAKILEENIQGDINCIQQNLDQFVKFVRRANPNYVGRNELQSFIHKFFPKNREKVKDILKLIYDLNSLLLHDPRDNVSLPNISVLFELFRVANKEGRALSQHLKNYDKNTYWENRDTTYTLTKALSEKAVSVIKQRKANNATEIDIIDFLDFVKKKILKPENDSIDLNVVKDYLFVKKLLLGGQKATLSAVQMEYLLEIGADLLVSSLDAMNLKTKKFTSENEESFFYYDLISEFQGFFHPFGSLEHIVDQSNLLKVIEKLLDGKYSIVEQMGPSIRKIKPKLIGGEKEFYSFADVSRIVSWGKEFFSAQYFNSITYDHFKQALESGSKIINIRNPKLTAYENFSKNRVKHLWNEFKFVTENYRYYNDENNIINFHNTYKRTKAGFKLNTTIRFVLKKLVAGYGSFRQERRKEVSIEEMRTLVYDLEGILKEPNLNFWPRFPEKFITEAVNGSDLFSWQGDGNTYADLEEATEYFLNILSASKLEQEVHSRMKAHCPLVGEKNEDFDISCYRQFWFQVFFDELHFETYFPKLKKYLDSIGGITGNMAAEYLLNLELYAREIPDEQLPMTKVDIKRLIIAFSNLEGIIENYDTDKDGVLRKPELDRAFLRFRKLIIKVGGLKKSTEFFAPSIFLYLIKKMKQPTPIQLALFHFLGKKKNIKSTRFNIAAILSFFVEQAN